MNPVLWCGGGDGVAVVWYTMTHKWVGGGEK